MVSSAEVIACARSWVGVPFRHQGRTRDGVDCIGLVVAVARELQLLDPGVDRTDYGRLPMSGELERAIAQHCTRVAAAEPGALLVVRWNREPTHVALCAGETMIHALGSLGRVVEHGLRGKWPERVSATYRLPGVSP
jgi:cell wall-associated NlpC family hydrolase